MVGLIMIDDNFNCLFLVVCPGPWASQILSKLGINLPLCPVKIPVYYWKVKVKQKKIMANSITAISQEFLPHTFFYDGHAGGNVWGHPEHEYPGLVKVHSIYVKSKVGVTTA